MTQLNYHRQIAALHKAIIEQDYEAMIPLTKLARHNEISTEARIDIYAKGYHIRLAQATFSDYPALAHLLGESTLKKYIDQFTHYTTSHDWDLNLYSSRFAAYFKSHNEDSSAIALCQLEAAICLCYWQEPTPSLAAEKIAQLDENTLGDTHFFLHKASQLLTLTADAESYLSAFRDEKPLENITAGENYLLITRPENQVMRYRLEKNEFDILTALQSGLTFNEALATIQDQETLANVLPTYLSQWFERQIFMDK